VATAQNALSQTASSFFSNLNAHEHDDGLSAFAGVSARLFGIAYRMLGNAADAEDIVQDVWLRWHSTNRRAVLDPPAFLATTTTRLCINHVQSARSRRETSIEARLHEPVDTTCNPGLGAERSEALRHAMLLVVEKLSPTERAVLILREAFEYSYRQIADLLKMGEENARQVFSRARRHIHDGRRAAVGSGDQRQLLKTFINAAQKGEMAALEGLLAADIASCSFGIQCAA
jgi:RNA polymerase sigma factor (sigma-70 family)